ncbi:MAG: hypothetical protein PVI40_05480 [Chlamydiota bacterium]|jgi:uncharacterized protein YjbI with pentapeptide repeats
MSTVSPTRSELPEVVWGSVLSFLTTKEQLLSGRVCTAWQRVSKTDFCKVALMRSISKLRVEEVNTLLKKLPRLVGLAHQTFNQSLDPTSKIKGGFLSRVIESKLEDSPFIVIAYLRSLSEKQREMIEALKFSCRGLDFTDEQVTEIIALCPKLKSLSLIDSKITGTGLAQIAKENKLEKINLSGCKNLDERSLTVFFLKAVFLREIDLSYTPMTGECLAHIPEENYIEKLSLRSLSFSSHRIHEGFLTDFFSKATHLKEVDLSSTSITGRCLIHILEKNQLEMLVLSGAMLLEENILADFFSKATYLRWVNLSGINITGRCLTCIPEKNHLEWLCLSSCRKLEEDLLAEFFSKATSLRKVTLSNTFTTGKCLSQIPKENHLEKLRIQECDYLEEDALAEFFSKASHLRMVNLYHTSITGKCLSQIPKENHLEWLCLNRCKDLKEDELADFFSKAAHLRDVSFLSTNITGKCLTQLPSKNCLEKLNLRNCINLIECFLASFFFHKAANLKEVNLRGTNITGEGLSFIAEKNKLKKIYLRECDNLKESFLACFFSKATHLIYRNVSYSNSSEELFRKTQLYASRVAVLS